MKALSLRRADASRSVFAEGRPLVDVKAIFSRQFLDQLLMQRYADRQERCGCIDLALGDRAQLLADRLHIFLDIRSEEHTSELQSLMRISYAVFCLKKKKYNN